MTYKNIDDITTYIHPYNSNNFNKFQIIFYCVYKQEVYYGFKSRSLMRNR